MNNETLWLDRDLGNVLRSMTVENSEFVERDDGDTISLEVEFSPAQLFHLLQEREEYLAIAHDEQPNKEDVVDQVADELRLALDIEYNTVGHEIAPSGQYRRVNDHQWKKVDNAEVYDDYSDLLFDITGEYIDFNEQQLSIPGLRVPFLEAVAESDEHELPPPGAVRTILSTHIDELREMNQSRGAVKTLKAELEREGVNPRTATRVANNMEELLVSDGEIKSRDSDE